MLTRNPILPVNASQPCHTMITGLIGYNCRDHTERYSWTSTPSPRRPRHPASIHHTNFSLLPSNMADQHISRAQWHNMHLLYTRYNLLVALGDPLVDYYYTHWSSNTISPYNNSRAHSRSVLTGVSRSLLSKAPETFPRECRLFSGGGRDLERHSYPQEDPTVICYKYKNRSRL